MILHLFVVRTALYVVYGGNVHRNDRIHKTVNVSLPVRVLGSKNSRKSEH